MSQLWEALPNFQYTLDSYQLPTARSWNTSELSPIADIDHRYKVDLPINLDFST